MQIHKKDKMEMNKGAAMMLVVFFFMFISLTILIGIITPVIREFKISTDNFNSKKSYFIAESGIEDIMYRIKNNMDVGTIGDERTLFIDDFDFPIPTNMTDIVGGKKQITIVGDVNSNQRTVGVVLSTDVGVSFSYGVQVGVGGITMTGSSGVNGNVYANGPIIGGGSTFISGTAISANSPSPFPIISNGDGIPEYNITFGNTNGTQDIAQSFKPETSDYINNVSLYIKKIGAPGNPVIKIVNDYGGSPGSTIYATGTLNASLITNSYSWVEISFLTNGFLAAGTKYWVIIDSIASTSKYFMIGASNGGYDDGLAKIGKPSSWANTTPSGLDYYFKIYSGGSYGLITGSSGSEWNQLSIGTGGTGSAQAHTVNYTEATGPIYCQTGMGNNKECISQTDPTYIPYPVSNANITKWKSDAEAGGIYNGNYKPNSYGTSTLGPIKINGNLTVDGSHTLKLTGTVWVTGSVTVFGSAKIILDTTTYGNTSGILVSDSWLALEGSGQLNGTGQAGSYILFTTTSNCGIVYCTKNAINISGAAGSVILNAPNGVISFSGSASAKEAIAKKIILDGNTRVNYETGLANPSFSSGPSGSWSINSWKETE